MRLKKSMINYAIIIILFIVLFLFVMKLPKLNKDKVIVDNVYINEIMPINKSTIMDSNDEYNDYIELYNNSDQEVNLKGFYLSDTETSSKKWSFPEIVIKPKEYLVVFASGKDKCDLNIRECHTNFKLGGKGETISLMNSNGTVISKIKYDKMDKDVAYSLIEGKFELTIGTPYKENQNIKNETSINRDVIINEVTINDPESIELKNITDKDIDLTGYFIEDKSGAKYEFNKTTIKANSYLVLYASDKKEEKDGKIYLGFKINNSREILYLYKNNKVIDTFNAGRLQTGISKGRNDKGNIVIYKDVTMGRNNSEKYYDGFSSTPTFSIDGGYVESNTKVSLETMDGSTIYYTIDGSTPTNKSTKYSGEITITKTTVIRAISYKDNFIESEIESRTFVVGRKHDLPVISISSDNNGLYGSNGIFTKGPNAKSSYPYYGANFWKNIEVPISFEYYEDGEIALNFNGGMKIFGGWSRGEAQKSVSIYLRKKYGLQEITYPFFTDNVNTFTRFILRSGGQDFGKLKLKDAFLQRVFAGQMDLDYQDYKPVVVYINGKYNGIYNIREKLDHTYVERHLGVSENDFDMIEKNSSVLNGSMDEYNKLLDYVKKADMKSDKTYEYLDSVIDLQELANFWVVETYFDQFDPMNIKYYKTKEGKWRWIAYDFDQTFFSYSYQRVKWNLPFEPYAHGNNYYLNTTLMSRLIKNPKFRELYIKTFAEHLNTTFKPDRMIKILDKMVDEIKNEMPYHIKRWYNESIGVGMYRLSSVTEWNNNISYFKKQIKERHSIALSTIKKGLGLTDAEYNKYFKK